MVATAAKTLTLRILDRVVKITCRSVVEFDRLVDVYGAMRCANVATADLEYTVTWDKRRDSFGIMRRGGAALTAHDDGEFIFLLEKDLTIELQHLRHDLYFIHAAVLEFDGKGILLVAPSGQGKSTTTWGLLHQGFRYLSDELAPVDLQTLGVYPYPHALCLKREPPGAYPLPSRVLRTSRTLHVPTPSLPGETVLAPAPVTAIFFLEYCPNEKSAAGPVVISKGEAAARLFAQALNPLAHNDEGLRAAAAIACQADCYRLRSVALRSTCDLLTKMFLRLPADEAGPTGLEVWPAGFQAA